jgi:hypothetical protein
MNIDEDDVDLDNAEEPIRLEPRIMENPLLADE